MTKAGRCCKALCSRVCQRWRPSICRSKTSCPCSRFQNRFVPCLRPPAHLPAGGMELLGDYGDSDDEEENKQGGPSSEAGDAVSVLPGFESFKPAAVVGSSAASPAVSCGQGQERVRWVAHGGADSDGTPGPNRLCHPALRAVPKSSTPNIHGSPAVHLSAP